MREETVKKERILVSKGNLYIIKDKDRKALYINSVVPVPACCMLGDLDVLTFEGDKYQRYTPKNAFLRDCLHTAEELMAGTTLKLGEVRSRISKTTYAFGNSESDNIKAAKDAKTDGKSVNDDADPNLGEAYVIVRTKAASDGEYPYHAAAVIAVDEADRITLEVFASGTDASEGDRKASGDFNMYSTSVQKDTFHSKWATDLGTNPITIVIELKPKK